MRNRIGSLEQSRHEVLLDLYKSAKNTASVMHWMVGGDLTSACPIDIVSKTPRIQRYADECMAEFDIVLEKIDATCDNSNITTIVSNAASELFSFIKYPSMPSHNNGCERIIRHRVVMPRRQKGHSPTRLQHQTILCIRRLLPPVKNRTYRCMMQYWAW